MKNNKNIILVIGIILLVMAIAVGSYALIVFSPIFSDTNTIKTGSISFTYNEKNQLGLSSTSMVSDTNGKKLNNYFKFNISGRATGTVDVSYYIYFTPANEETDNIFSKDDVKLYLSETTSESASVSNEVEVIPPTPLSSFVPFNKETLTYDATKNDYLIYSNAFNFNNTSTTQNKYYRLRLWLDENYVPSDAEITNDGLSHSIVIPKKTYKLKINVYGVDGTPVTITK